MSVVWDKLSLTEPPELRSFDPYVKRRDSQRLVQFLMALLHDFEGLRVSILHHNPLPSIDFVVSELLEEEARLKSYDGKKIVRPSVFTSTYRTTTSTSTQKMPYSKVVIDECAYCKQKGHWKSQCPNDLKRKSLTIHNRRPQQQ
nr:Gag-Pol polyprotein [Tanacetum cinerariifolium]